MKVDSSLSPEMQLIQAAYGGSAAKIASLIRTSGERRGGDRFLTEDGEEDGEEEDIVVCLPLDLDFRISITLPPGSRASSEKSGTRRAESGSCRNSVKVENADNR